MWLENQGAIQMWHGSRRWDGQPEIRGPRQGRYECGVGIYLTSSYETARKYSKGGGSTMLITLKPGIRYANKVQIPLETVQAFMATMPKNAKMKSIQQDIIANAQRMNRNTVTAEVISNLFVNYEAGAGQMGLRLNQFLVNNGVDASLSPAHGDEMWLVVMNPAVIANVQRIDAKSVDMNMWNIQNNYEA